ELDLLIVRGRRRFGFEFKYTDAPRMTRSTHAALSALALDRLDVVHAGRHTFPLAENVRALALARVCEDLEPLAQPTPEEFLQRLRNQDPVDLAESVAEAVAKEREGR
ncbi:MAG TPA: hypothetical protein VIJ61_09850, partial [Thermoanaerobaculia bacterium]